MAVGIPYRMKIEFDPEKTVDGFSPPGKFYFIRHGQTVYNRKGLVQGQTDAVLDEEGLAQARRAADELMEYPITRICSSSLKRALKTARIIADKKGCELKADPRLMERSYGVWEGKYKDEVGFSSSAEPEGCEKRDDFSRRVLKGLAEALDEESVLIVAHGGVLRVLGQSLGVELPEEARSNGKILEFSAKTNGE